MRPENEVMRGNDAVVEHQQVVVEARRVHPGVVFPSEEPIALRMVPEECRILKLNPARNRIDRVVVLHPADRKRQVDGRRARQDHAEYKCPVRNKWVVTDEIPVEKIDAIESRGRRVQVEDGEREGENAIRQRRAAPREKADGIQKEYGGDNRSDGGDDQGDHNEPAESGKVGVRTRFELDHREIGANIVKNFPGWIWRIGIKKVVRIADASRQHHTRPPLKDPTF
jgi:hypothetical protein